MKRKSWKKTVLINRIDIINKVLILRKKGKTMRKIADEIGLYPVQVCDIIDTNK